MIFAYHPVCAAKFYLFSMMTIFLKENAQRIGSPAADYSKITVSENHFSTEWPPRTDAEGGQVEPVLGSLKAAMQSLL